MTTDKTPEPDSKGTRDTAQWPLVRGQNGKSDGYNMARGEIDPEARHAAHGRAASGDLFTGERSTFTEYVDVMQDIGKEVAGGDLTILSNTMTAQALSLDKLFAQLVRRSFNNMDAYPDAMERYMRLALKAQAQSRSTIDSLVAMHQPREQTVRHIHVGPEGQAVFIENLHGGLGNGGFNGRAHSPSAPRAPLLGHDAEGNGVPVSGGEGKEAVPHARRRGRQRRTAGQ